MDTLLSRFERLHTAVVCDALDELGRRNQAMEPGFTRLGAPRQVIGRAATLEVIAVDAAPDVPYEVQFAAVDALRPGEVMIVATPLSAPSAFWGELITTRALAAGCRGAVVDGFARDVAAIRRGDFPLWARGTHPTDSCGRLDAIRAGGPIVCGGVTVQPGDIVFGDVDGVVVVPESLAEDLAAAAEHKAAKEDVVRAELRAGRTVVDAYDEHGVM